jgi:hypothetical protein
MYTLDINQKSAQIKGRHIDLSLKKNECSAKIAKEAYLRTKYELKKIITTSDIGKFVEVKFDGKWLKLKKDSSLENYLYNMPRYFTALKRKEALTCKTF